MANPKDVAVIVGSLRKGSLTRKVARTLVEIAPPSLKLDFVAIGDLPLFNQDLDTDTPPAAWTAFRDRIRRADAVLFVTPEYNRSMPGGLKNAIDVGSRPYGKNVFAGLPAAIVSVSPGAIGGFGANHHLRQSLVFLDVAAMPQPECYIGGAGKLFDDNDRLTNDSTREFLGKFLNAFVTWIERNGRG